MIRILQGTVHGRFREGATVEVELRDVSAVGNAQEAPVSPISDWSDEDDRIFEEIAAERKLAALRDIDL